MISLPNRPSGEENQDFLIKPAAGLTKLGFPYQASHLAGEIKISLPNRPSSKENQDFLTKPIVW